MTNQLPVPLSRGKADIVKARTTSQIVVPALIAEIGEDASWRYTEFFSANISNTNTRRAYARACLRFLAWCDDRGLTLTQIRPHDVATYIAEDLAGASAPNVKQQLAAVRMMFDWLVVGQMMPSNPAASVRGPKYVVKTGKTPVLEADEWRRLIDSIPTETVRDLRDRALIATLTYGFARVTAALTMKVEDLRPRGAGWVLRLHEKGGKHHVMPCHHAAAEALHAYIAAAGIGDDKKGWLFRTAKGTSRNQARPEADGSGRRLVHGAPARACRWYHGADRQPQFPRHRDHGLPRQWRNAGARAGDGGA